MTLSREILKRADHITQRLKPYLNVHPQFPSLDPFLYQILKLREQRKIPLIHQMDVTSARKMYAHEMARIKANFKVKLIKNLQIPLSDTVLNIRHYQPIQTDCKVIMVYFHGGGGVIGDLETHDDLCRLICQTGKIHVVSVDYRLAPEYPAPTAHYDAFYATEWIYRHRHRFLAGAEGICIAGDSAGGNLAISASLNLKRQNIPVSAQLLFYPSTDFTKPYPSETTYAEGLFLDTADRQWFQKFLFIDPDTRKDPNISVILAKDLELSPPTILRTAELDTLRDQAESYMYKLKLENIKVNFKREIGLGHGYANFAGISNTCYEAVVDAVKALKDLLIK